MGTSILRVSTREGKEGGVVLQELLLGEKSLSLSSTRAKGPLVANSFDRLARGPSSLLIWKTFLLIWFLFSAPICIIFCNLIHMWEF